MQGGLDIATVLGRWIGQPTLWVERVRAREVGATTVCRPLMNAHGDLYMSVDGYGITVPKM